MVSLAFLVAGSSNAFEFSLHASYLPVTECRLVLLCLKAPPRWVVRPSLFLRTVTISQKVSGVFAFPISPFVLADVVMSRQSPLSSIPETEVFAAPPFS